MMAHLSRINQIRCLMNTNNKILVRCMSDKNYASSDDEDKKKSKVEKKSKDLSERLNKLLFSMNTDDNYTLVKSVTTIPQAGAKKTKLKLAKEKFKKEEAEKPQNIIEAAKNAASSLGGDVKQTESELLSKLLTHSDGIDPKQHTPKPDKSISLNDLIVGMKIDRATKSNTDDMNMQNRTQYVKRAFNRAPRSESQSYQGKQEGGRQERRPRHEIKTPPAFSGSVNLFGETPLGIFNSPETLKDSPEILKTWSELQKRELKLAITHPPSNYFEKMILWTEQGKLWKFPIDNEQGLDEESKVYFADHVFLEQHLDPWCPTKGPIRHFMELVCVGLSKNPYITVKDKQDHIFWFKEYFEQKKDLLKDLIMEQKENSTQKEITK